MAKRPDVNARVGKKRASLVKRLAKRNRALVALEVLDVAAVGVALPDQHRGGVFVEAGAGG